MQATFWQYSPHRHDGDTMMVLYASLYWAHSEVAALHLHFR